jgi:BirA family biotin operon repressor/biotin-[acetyl-CoA-carboxylase] ligase
VQAVQDVDWRLEEFDTVSSTSDVVASRAAAGETAGLAVLARHQSAARGRAGRDWVSPAGNLALSVLLRPGGAAADAARWSVLVGVAVADALDPRVPPPHRLTLKWPNDLLLDGAKLAGILIESTLNAAGGVDAMVIGIGANLAVAPTLPDRPTACLANIGPPPAPSEVARDIIHALARWSATLTADGFGAIRAAWLARGPAPGTTLVVRARDERLTGAFAGLSDDGGLLLRVPDEPAPRAITVGEVS